MGRIFVCNDVEAAKYIEGKSVKQGFPINEFFTLKNYSVLSCGKKKICQTTVYKNGDDFCVGSGSFIFNGAIGTDALQRIYNAFSGDIADIRKLIFGNYAIVIKKGNSTYVFVDKFNAYSLYYYVSDFKFYICSSIACIGSVIPNLKLNRFGLFQYSFECACYGNETYLNNVYRLQGYEYILIDNATGSLSIKNIVFDRYRPNISFDEATTNVANALRASYGQIREAYGNNVGINMTGGTDSRVALGGMLSAGILPKLFWGHSNSTAVVGTEDEDGRCVDLMAQKFGLLFQKLNWDCVYPNSFNTWKDLFDKYGEYFTFYGGNESFHKSYESIENYPAYLDTGLGGESLRIREAYNNRTVDFNSLLDFINEYQIKSTNSSYISYTEMSNYFSELPIYMATKLEEEMKMYGFSQREKVSLDEFEEVRFIQARRSDTVLVNYLNTYTNCICVPFTEQVFEKICLLKKEYRQFAHAQLYIIDKLNPKLLDIPFFSHRNFCVFDHANFRLVQKKRMYEKIGNSLRESGMRDTVLYELLRKIKNHLMKNDWNVKRNVENESEREKIFPILLDYIRKWQINNEKLLNVEKIPSNESLIELIYYVMDIYSFSYLEDENTRSNK